MATTYLNNILIFFVINSYLIKKKTKQKCSNLKFSKIREIFFSIILYTTLYFQEVKKKVYVYPSPLKYAHRRRKTSSRDVQKNPSHFFNTIHASHYALMQTFICIKNTWLQNVSDGLQMVQTPSRPKCLL